MAARHKLANRSSQAGTMTHTNGKKNKKNKREWWKTQKEHGARRENHTCLGRRWQRRRRWPEKTRRQEEQPGGFQTTTRKKCSAKDYGQNFSFFCFPHNLCLHLVEQDVSFVSEVKTLFNSQQMQKLQWHPFICTVTSAANLSHRFPLVCQVPSDCLEEFGVQDFSEHTSKISLVWLPGNNMQITSKEVKTWKQNALLLAGRDKKNLATAHTKTSTKVHPNANIGPIISHSLCLKH